MKKIIFSVVITAVLVFNLTSYAYYLKASLVTYDNKQTTLGSLDVNGALNELGVLATTRITSLENEISDGKTLIANAITDKGVTTNIDASFDTMASNINNIKTGSGLVLIKEISTSSTSAINIDMTSYDGYQNFNEENFLIETTSLNAYSYSWTNCNYGGTISIFSDFSPYLIKSYNSETGILTISMKKSSSTYSEHSLTSSGSVRDYSANIYFIDK